MSDKLPPALDPVLAKIRGMSSLGQSIWHEVVYHDGNQWCAYHPSKTFTDGEQVASWVTVEDRFFECEDKGKTIEYYSGVCADLAKERDQANERLDYTIKLTNEALGERDQLRVRVAELYAALEISRGQWIHSVNAERCLKALNRQPAQSLAAHDARVLRGAADKYEAIYGHEWAEDRMSGHLWLRQQADRIEKEGE